MTPFTAIFLTFLCTFILWLREKAKRPSNLPPGPKPVPLLGNIWDLTPKELWLNALQWAREYGPVTSVHVFGINLIFVNTPEAAKALLDKKGSIYSDKPSLVMVNELCGCENMVAFTPYGDRSKRQRRLIAQAFGPSSVPAYNPLISTQTHVFLRRLVAAPKEIRDIARTYAGSLTLSVVYGYNPLPTADPFLDLAEECVSILSNKIASGGGIWPVDIFPSLKNLPEWAPGSGFLKRAREWKAKMEEFVDGPYEYMLSQLKAGKSVPSFCSTVLQANEHSLSKESSDTLASDLKWTANSMYSASMDTTITAVNHMLLTMIQNPDVLKKAQNEIDAVVGQDRLPEFSDRPSLPYLEAVFNEILRISAPVPLSLPHRLMEDDIYQGMFIPKGSLVFGNVYAISRDPSVYERPEEFLPERFLNLDADQFKKMDPREFVFGFGRRVCPGRYLIEASNWFLIASMIASLDISKAKDDNGNIIEPIVKYENSVFRNPSPFEYDIRPRSAQHLTLIRDSELLG